MTRPWPAHTLIAFQISYSSQKYDCKVAWSNVASAGLSQETSHWNIYIQPINHLITSWSKRETKNYFYSCRMALDDLTTVKQTILKKKDIKSRSWYFLLIIVANVCLSPAPWSLTVFIHLSISHLNLRTCEIFLIMMTSFLDYPSKQQCTRAAMHICLQHTHADCGVQVSRNFHYQLVCLLISVVISWF